MILILIIFIILLLYLIYNKKENFSNVDQDFINKNLTICMKTIYRRNLLKEHLKFIRSKYPNIKIIIADDSDKEYMKKTKEFISHYLDKNTEYIDLPYDSGLSKGRNECVKRVKTPYIVLTDDSRAINTNFLIIKKIISFLDNNDYGLVTGITPGRGRFSSFIKEYHLNKDKTIIEKNIDNSKNIKYNGLEFINIGRGNNTFIAKTDVLKNNDWNEKLKMGEHRTFFRKLFKNNIKILYCDKLSFKQFSNKLRKYDKNGLDLRRR